MANNALKAQEKAQEVSNNSPELDKENGELISRKEAIGAVKWGIIYANEIHTDTGEVKELCKEGNDALKKAVERIKALPSAQPKCSESPNSSNAVNRIDAEKAICNACGKIDCDDMDTCKKLQLQSAQPDLSEYSDKLWKAAYERGKAEAWQRWIPCSERLPEPRKAVLGYAPRYQNIYALYYDSAYGWMIWNPLRDDCFPNSQGEIVAWMPLPEVYREGAQE